jgi:uncharacterized protein YmfQ (DUF2313 family)
MNHINALKKLMPIDLGVVSGMDMAVEGRLLDSAAAKIMQLLPELYPSTTTILFERWEAEYGLAPKPGDTLEARRHALLARYIDIGNLSKGYFVSIAAALGYKIDIAEGGEANVMFRAGTSRAGDPVNSASLMWVWKVTTHNKPPLNDLKNLFSDLNPPHMRLEFAFSPE